MRMNGDRGQLQPHSIATAALQGEEKSDPGKAVAADAEAVPVLESPNKALPAEIASAKPTEKVASEAAGAKPMMEAPSASADTIIRKQAAAAEQAPAKGAQPREAPVAADAAEAAAPKQVCCSPPALAKSCPMSGGK